MHFATERINCSNKGALQFNYPIIYGFQEKYRIVAKQDTDAHLSGLTAHIYKIKPQNLELEETTRNF